MSFEFEYEFSPLVQKKSNLTVNVILNIIENLFQKCFFLLSIFSFSKENNILTDNNNLKYD